MFELRFDTDNDAFQDGNAGFEIRQILATISAKEIEANAGYWQTIRDSNGNDIGRWRYLDAPNAWRAKQS